MQILQVSDSEAIPWTSVLIIEETQKPFSRVPYDFLLEWYEFIVLVVLHRKKGKKRVTRSQKLVKSVEFRKGEKQFRLLY